MREGSNWHGLFLVAVLPLVFKLKGVIKSKKIDLVHINTNILLGIPMILAAKLSKIKVFCYIRESRALINREKKICEMGESILYS